MLREIDIEDFDLPALMIEPGSGCGRNKMGAVGLGIMAIHAAVHFRYGWQLTCRFARQRAG